MTTDSKPRLVYQIIINAPQERVWEAITTSEFTSRYYYGSLLKTDLTVLPITCRMAPPSLKGRWLRPSHPTGWCTAITHSGPR